MKLAVIGNGYVGTTLAVCLAHFGHDIIGIDIDKDKVDMLNNAKSPIYEPNLENMLKQALESKRLHFSTKFSLIENSKAVFLAVGTPKGKDGRANLSYLFKALDKVSPYINQGTVLITKSTVPVGTNRRIKEYVAEKGKDVEVISNPEFLREGQAVKDFLQPDRIVAGLSDKSLRPLMQEIYKPLVDKNVPILFTNLESAEMIKYAANSYLALSISYINEISRLCEVCGADINEISKGLKLDKRIGPHAFLNAGLGFGGSCFPKDVSALKNFAQDKGIKLNLLEHCLNTNEAQIELFARKILAYYNKKNIDSPTLALLGLSFKPHSDDVRESRAIKLANLLRKHNFTIKAHDPLALENAKPYLPDDAILEKDLDSLFKDSHGMVLATEWPIFQKLDFARIKKEMKHHAVFDGRNFYSPKQIKKLGFDYLSIGRQPLLRENNTLFPQQ
jgi:UDPglucose 6-dehydrogenase